MSTQLNQAKEALFGVNGLGTSNFKLFPGSSRESSAEEVARQINLSLAEILDGRAEVNEYEVKQN